MNRKLTRITPLIDGYAVVVVQEEGADGKPGKFLGCLLETPDSSDDGPYMLLAKAMGAYLSHTSKSPMNDSTATNVAEKANYLPCSPCKC
jgi:hypothetical protein